MSKSSCCCDPQTPLQDGDSRYSSSCCCEKCPSVSNLRLCFDEHVIQAPIPGCEVSETECAEPLDGPIWLGRSGGSCCTWTNRAYPAPIYGYVTTQLIRLPCWAGEAEIILETDEICMARNENNIGFLKRGLQEDVSCSGGWPNCAPCYVGNHVSHGFQTGAAGGAVGSISGPPFMVECGDNYDMYVDLSPVCHPGSSITPAIGGYGGDLDECDNLSDVMDGKYFWITDDLGDKFHVWFKKSESNSVDPSPGGSSGGFRIDVSGIKTCVHLKEAVVNKIADIDGPLPINNPTGSRKKWFVGHASSYLNIRGCFPDGVDFPESLCTFCVTARKTFRQNGNQPATVYDGDSGFTFGDGGAADLLAGMGNCCQGPAPRVFVKIPSIYGWHGGTDESDCVAGDPLCICHGVGGRVGPGGQPVITNYGTNSYDLYEYGMSGDFKCLECNQFTLRGVTSTTSTDTSHIQLPTSLTVCPAAEKVDQVGVIVVLDNDTEYGCPDGGSGGSWNTGSCLFNHDAENIRRIINSSRADIRVQVIKARGDGNLEVPKYSGYGCGGSFMDCLQQWKRDMDRGVGGLPVSQIWRDKLRTGTDWDCGRGYPPDSPTRHGFPPVGGQEGCSHSGQGQCGCYGIPGGVEGITGGGGGLANLPIGLTMVDNCSEVPQDPDMYGRNKDYCCQGLSATAPGNPCSSSGNATAQWAWDCPGFWGGPPFPTGPHWGCQPPGGANVGTCCWPPLSWCKECADTFPFETNRTGGVWEAGCSRVTGDDIKAAWDALTQNGAWIPDEFHLLYDSRVAKGNGTFQDKYFYTENQDQFYCGRGAAGRGWEGWRRTIGFGYLGYPQQDPNPCTGVSSNKIPIGGIEDEWTDAYKYILDSAYASGTGTRCDPRNYYNPQPMPVRRWLRTTGDGGWGLGDILKRYRCSETPALLTDAQINCPDREDAYLIASLGADGNPANFFDCPPGISPCWIQSSLPGWPVAWTGLKKVGKWGCSGGGLPGGLWPGNAGTCGKDVIGATQWWGMGLMLNKINLMRHNHPFENDNNLPISCSSYFEAYHVGGCCRGCPRIPPSAEVTISSGETCWSVNDQGQETETPKPLGGTHALPFVRHSHRQIGSPSFRTGCTWEAETSNNFFDWIVLYYEDGRPDNDPQSTDVRLGVTLFHRGWRVAHYEATGSTTDMSGFHCSGTKTLKIDRQAAEIGHGYCNAWHREFHVCDPSSWDHQNKAFALFDLNMHGTTSSGIVNRRRIHNATITLTSAQGTTRTYTLKTDGSADPNNLEFNYSDSRNQPAGIDGLANLIRSPLGHDGEIEVHYEGGQMGGAAAFESEKEYYAGSGARGNLLLVQTLLGGAGHTAITYNQQFENWCGYDVGFGMMGSASDGAQPAICPDTFKGGEWCPVERSYFDPRAGRWQYRGGARCFNTHPSSWPHSCPCKSEVSKYFPDTITVTL